MRDEAKEFPNNLSNSFWVFDLTTQNIGLLWTNNCKIMSCNCKRLLGQWFLSGGDVPQGAIWKFLETFWLSWLTGVGCAATARGQRPGTLLILLWPTGHVLTTIIQSGCRQRYSPEALLCGHREYNVETNESRLVTTSCGFKNRPCLKQQLWERRWCVWKNPHFVFCGSKNGLGDSRPSVVSNVCV